jgi:hypothetical protein
MPLYLIKYRLVTYPVLAFPQFEHPFKLATDASDIGLGAVLFQEYGGREHVVAYASRSLRPLKRTTLQQRGKHLALVWATKVFGPCLYGRKSELITDHCLLTWLMTIKDPRGRIARWIMTLEEHDWTISHKPGKDHTNADALSQEDPMHKTELNH